MLQRITFIVVVAGVLVSCLSQNEGTSKLIPSAVSEKTPRERRGLEFYADPSTWPENGVPGDVNVYPSYEERALGTWLNVVCLTLLLIILFFIIHSFITK